MQKSKKEDRLGEEKLNNQGCLMKIVEYVNCCDITVEFRDKYKAKVHTNYDNFTKGQVKNPYAPTIEGVGIIGNKYATCINRTPVKEFNIWCHMLKRCFNEKYKTKNPTYRNATCCEEWLYYPNFYEWLHSQENFKVWIKLEKSSLDKDILIKGNKLYSPETCCLVPRNVNSLFTKRDNDRGSLPIGVHIKNGKIRAQCNNPFTNKRVCINSNCKTVEEAFQIYKEYKENIIKQVAEIEYKKGNINKQCYEAMMRYEIEITD